MFHKEHALAYPKPQLTDQWQYRGTTILRNVEDNHQRQAGMPHPEDKNWAPLIRIKHGVQLPWPSNVGWCQRGSHAIGLQSNFPLQDELPTKADEPILPVGLLSEFPPSKWAADKVKRAPPAQSKPGYTEPCTRSRSLLLAGIQGVQHGA